MYANIKFHKTLLQMLRQKSKEAHEERKLQCTRSPYRWRRIKKATYNDVLLLTIIGVLQTFVRSVLCWPHPPVDALIIGRLVCTTTITQSR